jgi:hypothetical protein
MDMILLEGLPEILFEKGIFPQLSSAMRANANSTAWHGIIEALRVHLVGTSSGSSPAEGQGWRRLSARRGIKPPR